ncbi:MAG: sulfotransferase [Pleurocapsa sp.]
MLQVYYRIVVSAWKTFGFGAIFWRWAILMPIFIAFTHLTLLLDHIFFPQFRKTQVKNPIFIIGHPRSGNTFLHQLLTQTDEFVAFQTWQILFPSLTARVLVKPFVEYLIKKNKSSLIPEQVGHGVSLDKVEEEELLFFHKLDTQFVWARSPLGFDEQEHPEFRFHDLQAPSRRRRSINFFKGCLQRQIYSTGKQQVILQTLQSVHRIKTIIEAFPDAKFIYLVRSPAETIPSHLSVLWFLLDLQLGVKNIPADKLQRYINRRYQYNIDLYRYFYDLQKNQEIAEDQVKIVHYDQLRSNLEQTFTKIVEFTGIRASTQLKDAVKEKAQNQQNYRRKHQYLNLEALSLSEEQIFQDFDFVFEQYGFSKSKSI